MLPGQVARRQRVVNPILRDLERVQRGRVGAPAPAPTLADLRAATAARYVPPDAGVLAWSDAGVVLCLATLERRLGPVASDVWRELRRARDSGPDPLVFVGRATLAARTGHSLAAVGRGVTRLRRAGLLAPPVRHLVVHPRSGRALTVSATIVEGRADTRAGTVTLPRAAASSALAVRPRGRPRTNPKQPTRNPRATPRKESPVSENPRDMYTESDFGFQRAPSGGPGAPGAPPSLTPQLPGGPRTSGRAAPKPPPPRPVGGPSGPGNAPSAPTPGPGLLAPGRALPGRPGTPPPGSPPAPLVVPPLLAGRPAPGPLVLPSLRSLPLPPATDRGLTGELAARPGFCDLPALSLQYLGAARYPARPRLGPTTDARADALVLVRAYVAVAGALAGRPAHTFPRPEKLAAKWPRMFAAAAQRLREADVAPLDYVLHAFVTYRVGRRSAAALPSIVRVYDETRVMRDVDRTRAFLDDDLARMPLHPMARELHARAGFAQVYARAVLRAAGGDRYAYDLRAVWARFFPGDAWDRAVGWIRDAHARAAADAERLARAGVWVWPDAKAIVARAAKRTDAALDRITNADAATAGAP